MGHLADIELQLLTQLYENLKSPAVTSVWLHVSVCDWYEMKNQCVLKKGTVPNIFCIVCTLQALSSCVGVCCSMKSLYQCNSGKFLLIFCFLF